MNRSRFREGGLADGVKEANIPLDALHRSIVIGVADALQQGIPALPLDGWVAHQTLSDLVIVNERKDQINRLETEARRLRSLARNCRDLAAEESDPEVAAGYKDDVRRHTARASELARQADRLKTPERGAPLSPSFDGEVAYILAAMSTLLAPGGLVSKEERQALDRVIRNFALTRTSDDQVRWSLELLLPADGRVVTLGPISGSLAVAGRVPTPAEVAARANSAGAPLARRDAIHALMRAGFPKPVARAATLEPTGRVAAIMLGEEPHWPGCEPGFDHDAFNVHVRQSWPRDLRWAAGVYAQTNPQRQTVADIVAALGGRARLDQVKLLASHFGFKSGTVHTISLPYLGRGNTCWPPTVLREGTWSASTGASESVLVSPRCPLCERPCTAVVRVPEVPAALLCRSCRVMPGYPMLVFPPQYLDLALPPSVIPSELIRAAQDLPPNLTRKGPKPRHARNGKHS